MPRPDRKPTRRARPPRLTWAGRVASLLFVAVSAVLGQGTGEGVPAARKADRVAVIPIRGEIDAWTAVSVERRIKDAEDAGADAIVIELDTPGGSVDAVLRISNAIKGSSIGNTVAWVNHDAYSGGAIVALACREIVVNDPAAIGDAFQVIPAFLEKQGRGGLRAPTPEERTKILTLIISDVVDSARRHGYDEFLVQAMVIDGVELWLVEHTPTGRRYCVNAEEYRALFGEEPARGSPLLTGVTGGRYQATESGPEARAPVSLPVPEGADPEPADTADTADTADPMLLPPEATPESRRYRPASPELEDVAHAFESASTGADVELQVQTQRPDFVRLSEGQRREYRPLTYVCDGTNAVVMHHREAMTLGVATRVVRDDEELRGFFGASTLARAEMSWSEHAAAFLTSPWVRGVLIVVFLLALAIEMFSPGAMVPMGIALVALVGILAPPVVVGLAGWWEIAAIGLGIVLVGAEIFLVPGFGVIGMLGLVSIFVGLVGTFIPDRPGLGSDDGPLWGATTVLLGFVTAGVAIFFVARHLDRLPVLDRLILKEASGVASAPSEDALLSVAGSGVAAVGAVRVGDRGVAASLLRPVGTAEINGRLVEVSSGLGFIEAGAPVRVVSVSAMRVVVEPAEGDA